MKKLNRLLIILLAFFLIKINATAGMNFNIEKFGEANKVGNKISQPVNVSFIADGKWKILVEPIDNSIRNLSKPSKSLPLTRLEVAESSGLPLAHLEMGRSFEVKRGNLLGNNSFNLYLNTLSYNGDYPGNYVVDLKFTLLNDENIIGEEIYTYRFNQKEIKDIDFDNNVVNLSVSKDKALKKNYQENLQCPFSIYVNSNKDWKLYLIGKKKDDKNILSYYFKIMGVSDNTIEYNNSGEYVPMKDTRILIAKGKSTLDENTHKLMKKVINMDYMVKGPNNGILPAGTISTDFEYILETED